MRSWATSCGVRRTLYRHAGTRTEVLGREPRTCVRLAARRAAARCRQRQSRVRASDWAQDDSRLVGAKEPCLSHRTRSRATGTASIGSWRTVRPPNLPPASLQRMDVLPLIPTHRHHREPGPSAHQRHNASETGAGTMSVRRVSHARASRISPPPSPAPRWLGRGDVVRVGYGILCRSLPRVVCSVAARASDYRLPPKAPRISLRSKTPPTSSWSGP